MQSFLLFSLYEIKFFSWELFRASSLTPAEEDHLEKQGIKRHVGNLSHMVECGRIQLEHTRKGGDLMRLPVGQPCPKSLSPNLRVRRQSVFLQIHSTELLLPQIVSLSPCSWNLNWLCYFCNSCWKFCPFSRCSAVSMSAAHQMHLGVCHWPRIVGACVIHWWWNLPTRVT